MGEEKPTFPIKPISYFLSKSLGTRAVMKHTGNGFLNHSLTLCQNGKAGDGMPGAGPEVRLLLWLEPSLGKHNT